MGPLAGNHHRYREQGLIQPDPDNPVHGHHGLSARSTMLQGQIERQMKRNEDRDWPLSGLPEMHEQPQHATHDSDFTKSDQSNSVECPRPCHHIDCSDLVPIGSLTGFKTNPNEWHLGQTLLHFSIVAVSAEVLMCPQVAGC